MQPLKAFGYQNVQLKESHWKKQVDEVIATYLGIDNDDLLHYFRGMAGIPDTADGLVGWYGNDADVFGQILGAYAKLYCVTGDERLRKKAIALADGWGSCARQSAAVIDCNGTYVYDKLMGGFLDLYEYLDYAPAKEYVRALTESAARRLNRKVSRDGLQIMEPGMIEWYTLPEQLFRAWRLTGEQLYLDFAKEWEYPYFWKKMWKKDFQVGPRHAYSHVNSLSSAARAYEATGDIAYLEAIETAYEEILAHHCFATGGYGPAECLFPEEEGYLGDSIRASWDEKKRHVHYRDFGNAIRHRDDRWGSCEVSCCSWAVFKLTRYLMEFTGEAKYGSWAEKLLYNGCGGQLPVTPEGNVMYYASYFSNGAVKSTEDGRLQDNGSSFEWQCCTGTFPQDVAEYANLLYYQGEKGLYVSQYLASCVSFTVGKSSYTLENTSFYPKEKQLRFRIHTASPVGSLAQSGQEFSLFFRVPSWATGQNRVAVNGTCLTDGADTCTDGFTEADSPNSQRILPDTWLEIRRPWADGDEVELEFEFTLRFEAVDTYAPDLAALVYGPVILVCNKMTVFEGDIQRPQDWIEPVQKDGYSWAFRTRPGHVRPYAQLTRDFYPYYEVGEMEWYYMYNHIKDTE